MLMRVVKRRNPPEFPMRDDKDILYLISTSGNPVIVDEDKARAYCITWNDFKSRSDVKLGYFYDYLPEIDADTWQKKAKEKGK